MYEDLKQFLKDKDPLFQRELNAINNSGGNMPRSQSQMDKEKVQRVLANNSVE
jgi:hypothetical protein